MYSPPFRVILTERSGGRISQKDRENIFKRLCEIAFSPYGQRTSFLHYVQNDNINN